MLKFLMVILVVISLLSIFDVANGKNLLCMENCIKEAVDYPFKCVFGTPVIGIVTLGDDGGVE
ncbi:hypothetical protein DDB_G0273373 [Dictyostelium discoideum AX4]|uniref:Uncharacterized protein n=1 Tax=Dictyostelium discoideum TaxID=44689 RepID=Q557B9_DICDI|nr:hypothetical protein DDB_G0273667 [Dictyostelium discoideum AX4]XP_644800.1 hypothetical protein DDB_G0273373 [Dictyostelium discoideum AX4]EAL70524.1 hypothetical protein DDB_G0273667 [Dictyostelium discoideum AX4]EAL70904.1 hypothetical protein DDB_G0273373 [Dictyostelium discoideum AX4]|eukprot:XP_644450.1 hypothetical protein DDB_G0273667 [Dictyostelium discoideum AX4]